jgi:5'(3')-deoxyribonucleotidase
MAGRNGLRPEAASPVNRVIGLDCDGVLASGKQLWDALFAAFPERIPNSYHALTSFDWPRTTPETTELCLRLSADPDFTRRFKPMPHMTWALHTLRLLGWQMHVITARPPQVHEATSAWLWEQHVGHLITAVHCTEHKVQLAQELGCTAFVEDNFHTAERLGALGLRSYLINASYNRAPEAHCIRMSGWRELLLDLMRYQRTAHQRAPEPLPHQTHP